MAFIEWTDELSVGIMEIDRQHQTLIAMINDLFEAMKAKKGDQVIGGILVKLVGYTKTHFGTEEGYFARFGYTEAEGHEMAHREFVDKVQAFQEKFTSGSVTLSMEILRFLTQWLVGHIQGEDQKYRPFLVNSSFKCDSHGFVEDFIGRSEA